ncbi:uncharacterized protein LOC129988948 isoform X2 [Argiope bruennichi]|nr:uncharacterized protein LOC129988948 isoform X2 [Argiope bruennichi]XP_055953217.1 uncharacterized protein LOC129988948 isoform X2 [Argiope bruennichi]XP_055953218.1 uncharacterized protein LOC129988948 isoform X2 [Argiope bruennichi]
MTEDVDGGCSILNPSTNLATTVTTPTDVCTSISQLEGALYLNPGLTIDGSCLYTAADLAGNFPEGTVLQILPDSTILAVPPPKELANNSINNTTIIYKDSTFPSELIDVPNAAQVPNLLVETNDQNRALGSEVPMYSEGNISDIDLSFLNEAEESVTAPLTKSLNDSTDKDLQEATPIVSPQTLNVSQDSQSNNAEDSQGLVPDIPKESEGSTEGIVMIDVSKPIQLSQNSLIMVNGQKCVLQHDPQTGQVIAYPVKEQEKPRRKRGRPRKSSVDLSSKETSLNSELSPTEPEAASDEGKGLLEVVTDDGALVRRSTRRRKKAKVLKDYETGNLKQELGSDIEDPETLDTDPELHSRKRKPKGPGRPRKYPSTSADISVTTEANGVKRQRGRPKKQVLENEPTQAFLVQTADGQTLMMQVPLSSIPPGVSLQEVAQNIANRLNVGLSQTNSPPVDIGNILHAEQKNSLINTAGNTSEPAVQDHSIGSTTNFTSVDQFSNTESVQNEAEDSQQKIISDKDDIIVDSVEDSQVREIILQNENSVNIPCSQTENLLSENILQNPTQFSNLEIPQCAEDNFSLNIPTSNSSNNITSSIETLPENLNDQNKAEDIEVSFNQFQIPKDFLINSDFIKGKMNLNQLLDNVVNTSASQLSDNCVEQGESSNTKDISTSDVQVQFILNENNNLKDFENDFAPPSLKVASTENEKQFISQEIVSLTKNEKLTKNFDFLNCDISNSNLDSNTEKDSSQTHSIIDSIVHDHNLLIQSQPAPEKIKSAESSFAKPNAGANKKIFQPILPLEKATVNSEGTILSVPAATVVPVSSNQQLQLSDKMLPIILSPQELPGAQKCKVCQRPYFTDEEIIKHFKAEHPKCICNQCNYMAEHAYVIKRHSIRHIENGVVCDICGKHYKDHYILKMHIKMVHMPAEVMFTCEICEKKFTRKAHLKRHLRIHAPHRPFKCPFCSYRGCEKSDITKHLLIHEAPKHKCERCGKAFRHLKNKELHVKRHKKQRDYKCGICEFYGYTFTDIRKHIERRHTDAKTGTCLECGLVFKNKDELERHKSNGNCQLASESNLVVMEGSVVSLGKGEAKKASEIHLDILGETVNNQESNPTETAEEKVSPVQSNQLILNSDKITNLQNGQIIVNGLEGVDLFSPESLTLLPVGNDSNKLITLISADGRNFALPLKDLSSTNLEGVITTPDKSNNTETYFLSEFEPEVTT